MSAFDEKLFYLEFNGKTADFFLFQAAFLYQLIQYLCKGNPCKPFIHQYFRRPCFYSYQNYYRLYNIKCNL